MYNLSTFWILTCAQIRYFYPELYINENLIYNDFECIWDSFFYICSGIVFVTAVTIDETSKKLEKVKSGRLLKVVKTKLCL